MEKKPEERPQGRSLDGGKRHRVFAVDTVLGHQWRINTFNTTHCSGTSFRHA
ncbi:hypothetical protein ABZ611_23545 [Streptomyces sp. NPDC007861]|uniref:hypothetical protein n=1 Tax=Streptomyces sp. NPDC007861 TaxID=3154893 RepID=UPI0033E65927